MYLKYSLKTVHTSCGSNIREPDNSLTCEMYKALNKYINRLVFYILIYSKFYMIGQMLCLNQRQYETKTATAFHDWKASVVSSIS